MSSTDDFRDAIVSPGRLAGALPGGGGARPGVFGPLRAGEESRGAARMGVVGEGQGHEELEAVTVALTFHAAEVSGRWSERVRD